METKKNIYEMVTNRIIEQLQKGIVPWQRPWSGASLANGGAINYCTRKSDMKSSMFGGEDYSREELVAELGSAMLCNASGLDCDKAFKNGVAYIQGWLSKLKNDNKMIIWASSRAEKAAKYIIGIKDEEKQ